jgi:hypothetical protein
MGANPLLGPLWGGFVMDLPASKSKSDQWNCKKIDLLFNLWLAFWQKNSFLFGISVELIALQKLTKDALKHIPYKTYSLPPSLHTSSTEVRD